MDIRDAADVWNVAHTITLSEQNVKTMSIGEGFGGCGDSRHFLDWAAGVRKLVYDDDHAVILDAVYGDTPSAFSNQAMRVAEKYLRKFMIELSNNPDTHKDYHKMRLMLFG